MKVIRNVLLLTALCVYASAQSNSKSPAEQRFFNLEDAVLHQVDLSAAELSALAADAYFKGASQSPSTKLTQDGLEAAAVHLCGSSERDLVVIGDGAQYAGANGGPFWIIRDLPTGPQIVLQSGMLGLTIEASRSNKCLNVESFTATADEGTTTDFRFNGQKYVVYNQKTAKLGR
jgi:hypothetical protein